MADRLSDVIYCAGFFDGEGSMGAYCRRYLVTASNTDVRPLKKFIELWGGKIHVQKKNKLKGANMDVFHWRLYGHNSRTFLNEIYPYTIVKKDQIKLFLEILDVLPVGRGTRRTSGASNLIELHSERIRRLKRMG
jgi:hypothetical protein